MNYPIWDLTWAGGGLLIAVIAVIHVYIAHFAIGGGLFLILTEKKALRENSPGIMAYTKRHAKFFMIVTMVLGGLTGVGIWFTISLISPQATSSTFFLPNPSKTIRSRMRVFCIVTPSRLASVTFWPVRSEPRVTLPTAIRPT